MSEPQEIIRIGKNELVGIVVQLCAEGYRLVQVGCSTLEAAYELNYSFDKDNRFKNLRVMIVPDEEVPSISMIYQNAFLYENEIHDLFGVVVTNISIDYHGTLYRTSIRAPFSVDNVKLPEPPKQKTEVAAKQKDTTKQPAEGPEGQKE
jgi:ech hydrogenase subunit D